MADEGMQHFEHRSISPPLLALDGLGKDRHIKLALSFLVESAINIGSGAGPVGLQEAASVPDRWKDLPVHKHILKDGTHAAPSPARMERRSLAGSLNC